MADRWSVPAEPGTAGETAATAETAAPEPAEPRLPLASAWGGGRSGTLVRDYLAARPDEDLGPTQVGKALGRSQGAVSNSLAAWRRPARSAGEHHAPPLPHRRRPVAAARRPVPPPPGAARARRTGARLPHIGGVGYSDSLKRRAARLSKKFLSGRSVARRDSDYPAPGDDVPRGADQA